MKLIRVRYRFNWRVIVVALSKTRYKIPEECISSLTSPGANCNSPRNSSHKYKGDWFFKEIYNPPDGKRLTAYLDEYREAIFCERRKGK